MIIRKKDQFIKFILTFVIMIILSLPGNSLSFEIKSMDITRTGEVKVFCSPMSGCSTNRPVMVRVAYSCDNNPNKLFNIDREALQVKDKWGDWLTDSSYIRNEIYVKLCQEKVRDEEKLKAELEKEREKERERILRERERILKEEGHFGREWIAYERDDKGKYYYDNKHMKIVYPNVIQVWDKLEFDTSKEQLIKLKKGKKKIEPNSIKKDEEKLMVLQEIDCTNKTYKVIRSIFYETEYDPYEKQIDFKNTIPATITGRSTNMTLLEKVCSKEKLEEIIREKEKSEFVREQEENERLRKQQEEKERLRESERIKELKREEESKKRADENWEKYLKKQ